MKFSTSTMMLAVAFLAIAITGVQITAKAILHESVDIIPLTGVLMPFWMPAAFCAFAIAQRQLTTRMVAVFAILEAASVGIAKLVCSIWPF
jgi:hypothetical protein